MLIVKIMSVENLPDDDPRKSHSLVANVSSVSFNRDSEGAVIARLYVRDEVKTAACGGYVDHETFWEVPANAYVMNDKGKTVSTFWATPDPATDLGRPAPLVTAPRP